MLFKRLICGTRRSAEPFGCRRSCRRTRLTATKQRAGGSQDCRTPIQCVETPNVTNTSSTTQVRNTPRWARNDAAPHLIRGPRVGQTHCAAQLESRRCRRGCDDTGC